MELIPSHIFLMILIEYTRLEGIRGLMRKLPLVNSFFCFFSFITLALLSYQERDKYLIFKDKNMRGLNSNNIGRLKTKGGSDDFLLDVKKGKEKLKL